MSLAEEAPKGVKRRRVTQACDYCHQRSIRCRISESDPSQRCQNCVSFDQPCTRNRPAKKRGVKPRNSDFTSDESTVPASLGPQPAPSQIPAPQPRDNGHWRAPHVAGQALIVDLIEVYFDVVYPIFPLFHRPSFSRKVSVASRQS